MTAFSITFPPRRILGIARYAGKRPFGVSKLTPTRVRTIGTAMSRVVCLSFPLATGPRELERIRAIGGAIEVVAAPYTEDEGRRRSRHLHPVEELRTTAPPLDRELRAAFERAEVILAFDLPVGLGDFAPKLRWVQSISAGTEFLAGCRLEEHGVIITNSSGVAARSIAEFVVGRLLAIWKRFPEMAQMQREKQWAPTFGRTIGSATIGIVGVGAIGSAVARLAKAFGATVLGLKRTPTPGLPVDQLYAPDGLHSMLARCDAVVLAAPASGGTRHLLDQAAFAAMRPGAVLVNVARGSLVDEAALVEALEGGRLAAAALDVFETEPLPASSPLWTVPNCHISAHCSVSLDRYVDDVMALFEDNLRRYLAGQPLRNVVDAGI
jgi:phosphoglycerate dehydrogenase-like enzyme